MSQLFEDESAIVIIYFRANDAIALEHASALIEEGQWIDLKKGWRARADNPHPGGSAQRHVHLELRRHQVGVVNRDMSPSHGYENVRVPNRIWRALRSRGLIDEAADRFFEHASLRCDPVPLEVIEEASKSFERIQNIRSYLRTLR